jgi:hypothetical protein
MYLYGQSRHFIWCMPFLSYLPVCEYSFTMFCTVFRVLNAIFLCFFRELCNPFRFSFNIYEGSSFFIWCRGPVFSCCSCVVGGFLIFWTFKSYNEHRTYVRYYNTLYLVWNVLFVLCIYMGNLDISFGACHFSRICLFVSIVLLRFVPCVVFWMLFFLCFFRELCNPFRFSFNVYEGSSFFYLVSWNGVFVLFVCGGVFLDISDIQII